MKLKRRVKRDGSLLLQRQPKGIATQHFTSLISVVITGALIYVGYYMNAIYHELHAQRQMRLSTMGTASLDGSLLSVNAESESSDTQHSLASQQETRLYLDGNPKPKFAILHTPHGDIRILLRPDFSSESVEHILNIAATGSCPSCIIYSALRPPKATDPIGIVQGTMSNSRYVHPIERKGPCPAITIPPTSTIQSVDPECHGPVMTKGMVAWSGGNTGPAFFINTFKRPAHWWGFSHTVFGQVLLDDAPSWATINTLFDLPVVNKKRKIFRGSQKESTLKLLQTPIRFSMSILTNEGDDMSSNTVGL